MTLNNVYVLKEFVYVLSKFICPKFMSPGLTPLNSGLCIKLFG